MPKEDLNEPVTRGMLDDAVAAILDGMDKMVGGLRSDMNMRFESTNAKINQTKNELKDEIDGLKADLSNTPSRKEFEELKARVEKHNRIDLTG